jgi:fido (protein-threonine AMPylation protein)
MDSQATNPLIASPSPSDSVSPAEIPLNPITPLVVTPPGEPRVAGLLQMRGRSTPSSPNRNPLLFARLGKSSPLTTPKAGGTAILEVGTHPTSPATNVSSGSKDRFWFESRDTEARQFLESIASTNASAMDVELSNLEAQVKVLGEQVSVGKEQVSANHSSSARWGWATGISMASVASIGLSRYFGRLNAKTASLLAVGAVIGVTGAGYAAVAAENREKQAHFDVAVLNQLLLPLDSRLAELQNTRAVVEFYAPAIENVKQFVSGKYFNLKARLFENKFTLRPSSLTDIEKIHDKLRELHPLPVSVANALAVEIAALTVYHSNKIEDAGLGLSETQIIIQGLFCPAGPHLMSRFLETWTHARALARVIDYLRVGLQRHNLRPSHLREVHACLMAEEPMACPGSWRKDNAYIATNATQVLATPLEIESLVQSVFQYINESQDHDLEILVNAHAWLLRIHPFADGNGRTIRLLLVFLAMSSGYTAIAFTCGAAEYFDCLRSWDSDPDKFGSLVVRELQKMSELYEAAEVTAAKFIK